MAKFFSFIIILSCWGYSLSLNANKPFQSLNPVANDSGKGFSKDIRKTRALNSLRAEDIWNNYITALGGPVNLKKLNDRAVIMESNINGQKINIETYQKAPDKMKQILTTSSIVQYVYFDGVKGVILISGKEIKIAGSELEKLKYDSMINFVINIDSLGIKLNSGGIEKVNNIDCYKVEVILPSGSRIIQYFDVKTFLKVKQIENVTVTHSVLVRETYFSDYREFNGTKYPFIIKEILGSQIMDLSVTSIKVNTGLADAFFNIR
jgi:hypothetical protein